MNSRSEEVEAAGKSNAWLFRLYWLPILLFLPAIVVLRIAASQAPHESPVLLLIANFVFSTAVSLLVVVLIGRSYILRGSPGLLLLGCGVLFWGAAGTISPFLLSHGANASISLHNTLIWISALCHLTGGLLSMRPFRAARFPALFLALGYAGALVVVWLIILLTIENWMPVFFIEGQGGTPLRTLVLGSAVAMFAFTTAVLWRTNRPAPFSFVHWYGGALLLVATGLVGVMLQSVHGSLLGWTGRAAQFLGGGYMLAAAVASVRESSRHVISLAGTLRMAEARYRTLFENMTEGFALNEIVTDEQGRPVDYRFLDVNPAFERLTGLSRTDIVGKRVLEILPGTEAHWIESYGRVASTGEPVHFENFSASMGRWYEVFAYRPEPRQFAVVFTDVTERRQAADALRANEERLRRIAQAGRIGFFEWNAAKDSAYWSPEHYEMFGFEPGSQVTWERWLQGVHPEDRDRVAANAARLLERGRVEGPVSDHKDEYRYTRPDGSMLWIGADLSVDIGEEGPIFRGSVRDITERKRAEEQMARDLDGMTRLQEIGTLSVQKNDLEPVLAKVVDAAIAISDADFGDIQLLDPASGDLRIAVQRGFPEWWFEYWDSVAQGRGSCGTALERGERVIVEDVEQSPIFAGTPALDIQRKAGVRAVQSTPLVSRSGRPLGMFSTHYRAPHRPDDRALRLLDLLARHAADIMEQMQSEAEAERARNTLAEAQKIAHLGSFEYIAATRETVWSEEEFRIYGLDPAGPSPTYDVMLHKCIHPDDAALLHDTFTRAMQSCSMYELEHRIVQPDGRVRWVYDRAHPYFDKNGELLRYVGATLDITERKETEAALRESEERFRLFMDNSPTIAWIKDEHGHHVYLSRTYEERFGASLRNWRGKTDAELWPAEIAETFRSNDRVVLDSNRPAEVVEETINPDGTRCYWLNSKFPFVDSLNNRYVAGIGLDITDRKAAEAALQEAHDELERRVDERTAQLDSAARLAKAERQQLFDVLETLPAYVCLLTPDYHVPFANRIFREWFDYSPKKKCYEFLFQRSEPCERCETYSVLRTHGPHRWEWTGPNGRDYDIFDFPFSDTDGSPLILEMGMDITERKQAERALRDLNDTLEQRVAQRTAELSLSRENLDRAQAVGQIGWWRLDTRNNVLTWSDENYRIFGVPIGTVLSYETFLSVIHPDDREYVNAQWQAALRGEPYDIEHRIVPEGRVKWVREKAYLELNDRGELLGGFGITQDISSRRQAEEALRESETLLRAVTDSNPDPIFMKDRESRLLFANPATLQLIGRPAEEVLGRTDEEFYANPADGRAIMENDKRMMEAGLSEVVEEALSNPDGSKRFFMSHKAPLYNGRGQVVGLVGVAHDITERKRSEIALSTSEARLRLLADVVGRLLVTREPQQIIKETCTAVMQHLDCQMFFNFMLIRDDTAPDGRASRLHLNAYAGIPEEEAAGIEWLDFGVAVCGCVAQQGRRIVAEDIPNNPDPDTELVSRYGALAYACHPLTAGGRMLGTLSFGTTKRAHFADHELALMKTVADHVAVAMERLQGESALRRLNETLEQRVAARTTEVQRQSEQLRALAVDLGQTEQRERQRLAKILHDNIQQLLVAAQMQLSLIKGGCDPAIMRSGAQGVSSILTETLEASRSLTVELYPPVLHQSGLVAALSWLAARVEEKQHFRVHLRTDTDAEPADPDVRAFLFEAARELLLNAIKHSGEHSASLTMARLEGHVCRIIIEDEGRGFDPASVKPGPTGGFGVFSIQQRLLCMGGSLEIESAPGQGTRAILAISIGQPAGAEEEPPGTVSEGGAIQVPFKRKGEKIRILLVDDHRIMRQGISALLEFESDLEIVAEAEDGLDAVEQARLHRPDVVIMDVNLPRMSGIDATQVLTRELPGVKVIGLSMHVDGEAASAMRAAGATAYLTKGGPSEDLIAAVRACMRPGTSVD